VSDLPKISIVTPSYNQGQFLEKTILSVLEQGYPSLEYVIIDGGSSDNSLQIIKKYEAHLDYWISEPDRGQSHAINKGFKQVTGDLLTWLNSDDYYAPKALHEVADMYLTNPMAGAIVGSGKMVDINGNILFEATRTNITLESLYDWFDEYFLQPSCFFRREVWTECGQLNEQLSYAMDLDLWIKIARRFDFVTTNATLSYSLRHVNAKTTKYAYLSHVEAVFVILRYAGEGPARALLEKYAQRLTEDAERAHAHLALRDGELFESKRELEAVYRSLSWKVTKPLRCLRKAMRRYRPGGLFAQN
jgi:glycosyltransferase involved in cell wall biosynthesis